MGVSKRERLLQATARSSALPAQDGRCGCICALDGTIRVRAAAPSAENAPPFFAPFSFSGYEKRSFAKTRSGQTQRTLVETGGVFGSRRSWTLPLRAGTPPRSTFARVFTPLARHHLTSRMHAACISTRRARLVCSLHSVRRLWWSVRW